MSFVSTRRRRDRHIIAQVEAVAAQAGRQQWAEWCESVNSRPWPARLALAWQLVRGRLT